MRLFRHFLIPMIATLAMFAAYAVRIVDHALGRMLDVVEPLTSRFHIEGWGGIDLATPGGDQIDAATFQQSRHESAVHRRSADRHV